MTSVFGHYMAMKGILLSLLYITSSPAWAQDFDSYYAPNAQQTQTISPQYQQNSSYPNSTGGSFNQQVPTFYYRQPQSPQVPTYNNNNQFGGYNQQQSNGFNNQQQYQGFANQQAPAFGQQQQLQNFNQPQQRPNLFQLFQMANGAQQTPQQQQTQIPAQNPFGMRSLMKTFFDGGATTGPAGAAGDRQALSTAQSNCQTAQDQASQAEGCESRTRYGDKGGRMSAASEAQNHANAARAAANRATSAAAGHFSPANDSASQARSAADRAQAAADRAGYNAGSAN